MTAACPACAAAPAAVDMALPKDVVQLSVPAIRCAACISAIEDRLSGVQGVNSARVNLTQKRVAIETELAPEDLVQALAEIGYDAHPLDAASLGAGDDPAGRDLLLRLGVAGFAMMNVMLLSVAVWSGASGATRDLFHLISAGIALPAVLYAAQPFFRNAWSALRVGRVNMDVPISLAILLAGGMSLFEALNGGAHAYFDAALSLTFFLLIGRYLEHRTRSAARNAAKELAALEVHTAQRLSGGKAQTVPIAELTPGDTVLVPTGVRVPVDGHLLSRAAHTDRSFLTGESEPVSHESGAVLNAGEINLGRPFEMQAEAIGKDTRLHRIAQMVETAETARNRYTSLADRAARIYVPAVHLLAGASFAGWLLATGDLRHALNIAIAVLIITCPCALGLAVPAVSTAAISRLYRLGFLVKSGTALERLADVKTLVLDKTGTLTRPGFFFDISTLSAAELGVTKALAMSSAHPLSKELSAYLGDINPAPLEDIEEVEGRGVRATWGGTPVALGQAAWLGALQDGLVLKKGDQIHPLPNQEVVAPDAKAMVSACQEAGLKPQILSGDTNTKTAALADAIGVTQYRAGLSPEQKNDHVADLERRGALACMVGDGLNDTGALSTAYASVAPGTALDAARSAADVVMIGDRLARLPELFAVARRAVYLSRMNFGIAAAYNAIAIPIAVLGFATPLMAALAMSFSSITVIANAARIGLRS
ncbi:Type cbb3 cytochrome oxidase biogenesis protein CcoI [Candidatus Rhodobacter oscarellae]|uniref:Type cbb3 cytochrome oxidase biogenesis protein CcoI n=1 Tax=Candidatus Rhodobacter oscarellae TaxID=1675527 RepID=A0A0J9EBC5_9RHOB|nr:heavy metal translocating P-type ATPase [Candidatus Rhodobacter lobularis]KMW60072.1 Type cbb3 cytochrome oxidase biogenesis protein CcoI [Candidatus Rhodobacter lobularis]